MAFDAQGRRIMNGRNNGGPILNKWLCLFIVGLPTVCLYAGYSIGMHFSRSHGKLLDRQVIMDATRLNYSWYGTHNLSITFRGNLGNQLFQYAALYGLSKANGYKPLVPKHLPMVKMFPGLKCIVVPEENPGESFSKFRELKSMAFDSRAFSLNFMKNIELVGFFQSWRYFDHVNTDIRKQLQFPEHANAQVQAVLHEALESSKRMFFDTQKSSPVFVGIHVRRGDLLSEENVRKGYVTASETYINTSMDYFINKYEQVIFVVATDDMEWSKQHVKMRGKNPVIFSPFEHEYPAIDLCLLSHCNHTIMTVGTFGWWAGFLAGGETIYYKKFPKSFSAVAEQYRQSDYFIPQWYAV